MVENEKNLNDYETHMKNKPWFIGAYRDKRNIEWTIFSTNLSKYGTITRIANEIDLFKLGLHYPTTPESLKNKILKD